MRFMLAALCALGLGLSALAATPTHAECGYRADSDCPHPACSPVPFPFCLTAEP